MKIYLNILFFLCTFLLGERGFAECVIGTDTPAGQFLADCADGTKGVPSGGSAQNTDDNNKLIQDKVKTIANSLISFGALLAVGALVWSGIQYTKAYGEEENIKKAKTTGIYALIGLILLLISFGIVDIFINFLYSAAGSGGTGGGGTGGGAIGTGVTGTGSP